MPPTAQTTEPERREGEIEHVDVLIVGAGLSGIGAACHFERRLPGKSYAILEARDSLGGTWDLFRYPGIRSDSDMYTLGYVFKPWREAKSIADGGSILSYIQETAEENGIGERIRFGHRAVRASYDSQTCRWTVTVNRTATGSSAAAGGEEVDGGQEGESVAISCSFLFMCTGYYRYDEGFTPQFAGQERFAGTIVHPQHWDESLDYGGKRVVVIGSGATAVTLVPAMAERAEHVTMLQRSPTYVVSLPGEDPIAGWLRRRLPNRAVYPIVRWKNVLLTMLSFQLSRRRPAMMKAFLRKRLQALLPEGYDVDTHFTPSYDPWDQRLCLVPDSDLFEALGQGSASVVTDHVESFTETGIRLRSGAELPAEVIVTATGLNLLALGGIELAVDGREIELGQTMSYKGMMLSGVPNLAFAVGYTNASWTLKCDLTCEYVCRLLAHMDAHGYAQCVPQNDDASVEPLPFIDFSSGYVQRAIAAFPKQGSKRPWRLYQNYALDVLTLRRGSVADEAMRFSRRPVQAPAAAREPVAV
ncbi:MAG TPA: NAD(P)/FAD-dependent oxidoreductase [Solirubrobacteraceae bacterium]|jgi:cation diffusion facilitator CzcD-associated flavoprotein CzcO|nr:NAD(P)/FAD-dependent oxidoreductase [Solirubrobacteraceae bacterium]